MLFIRKTLLWFLLLFIPGYPVFADWNHEIIHYQKNTYAGGTQTWQINSAADNRVFMANKKGLLEYDGSAWELHPFPNRYDVRCVRVDDSGRVYCGGINELGYYQPDSSGKMVFTSLNRQLTERNVYVGNVWNCLEQDRVIYFQGDGYMVKYINDICTPIPASNRITASVVMQGVIYVAMSDQLAILMGEQLVAAPGAEFLEGKPVCLLRSFDGKLLVGTTSHGLYLYDGKSFTEFLPGATDFLKDNELFSLDFSERYLAIGSVRKGILLYDLQEHTATQIHQLNGLQDNTVLSLHFDARGNLWCGLDSGIDYILLNHPVQNLYTSSFSLGSGYGALVDGKRFYFATNRGVFVTSWPLGADLNVHSVRMINGLSGQAWDLGKFGDELFCFHDRGLFRIVDHQSERIGEIIGVWGMRTQEGVNDRFWVGTYSGIYRVERKPAGWQITGQVASHSDSSFNFEFENDSTLWVHNDEGGILRMQLDPVTLELKSKQPCNNAPTKAGYDFVFKTDQGIRFTTTAGICYYDSVSKLLLRDESFSADYPGIYKVMKQGDREVFFYENYIRICSGSGNQKRAILLDSGKDLIETHEKVIFLNDSICILPDDTGFKHVRLHFASDQRVSDLVRIRKVSLSQKADSVVYAASIALQSPDLVLTYRQNALRFEYGNSFPESSRLIEYRFRLKPDQAWSVWSDVNYKEFTNLPHGKYAFQVEARFPDGTSGTDQFEFRILPPWYYTHWAWLAYMVFLVCLIFTVTSLLRIRIRRQQKKAVLAKEQELLGRQLELEKENARNQQQILELEREKLEYQLHHKSQELADLMINFTRKNDMLSQIKDELHQVMRNIKGDQGVPIRRLLLQVNEKIDSNMDSDNVLIRIEEQFNLVHNNFIKRLCEKHPDISPNEKMMCAYLKMNLSTKEIAPLLNISVRGVETMRYRLRKKFELDRDESLTDYLNQSF